MRPQVWKEHCPQYLIQFNRTISCIKCHSLCWKPGPWVGFPAPAKKQRQPRTENPSCASSAGSAHGRPSTPIIIIISVLQMMKQKLGEIIIYPKSQDKDACEPRWPPMAFWRPHHISGWTRETAKPAAVHLHSYEQHREPVTLEIPTKRGNALQIGS